MAGVPEQPISGHVFRFEGKRGPVWRAKYRLPDGRQVQRRIGPAWTAAGKAARRLLHKAHRRGMAALRARQRRERDAAGAAPDRRHRQRRLRRVPALPRARAPAQAVNPPRLRLDLRQPRPPAARRDDGRGRHVRRRRAWAASRAGPDDFVLSNRTRKTIVVFHGLMERARRLHRLPGNPVADVEKPGLGSTEIEVFSPEEVMALVRAADAGRTPRSTSPPPSPASAKASSSPSAGETSTSPAATSASGQLHQRPPHLAEVRQGPLRPDGHRRRRGPRPLGQREHFTGPDDLVFASIVGGHLDGSRSQALPRGP